MNLSPSTYYRDSKVSRQDKEENEANIRGQIESVRVEFPRTGYRTLQQYLKRRGVAVSEYKLRKVINKFSLQLRHKKKFIKTTDSDHDFKIYPNLVKDHELTKLNEVWVSDITYIRVVNGFVYLAVILDLYSRKVIGWGISKNIDTHLTLAALEMAFVRRGRPTNVIHHSDRGVQYLSQEYVKFLKSNNFKISCSRKANPYDNAWAESFMKTLKVEEVYLFNYETIIDVSERV